MHIQKILSHSSYVLTITVWNRRNGFFVHLGLPQFKQAFPFFEAFMWNSCMYCLEKSRFWINFYTRRNISSSLSKCIKSLKYITIQISSVEQIGYAFAKIKPVTMVGNTKRYFLCFYESSWIRIPLETNPSLESYNIGLN